VKFYFEHRLGLTGGKVVIEDLPWGSGLEGADPGGPSPETSDLGAAICSPLALGQGTKATPGAALLVPLQVVLAGLWFAWRRRRLP